MRLHLQTPRSNRLRFLAGQRVTLGLSAGVVSSDDLHAELPVASCPCDDRNLIFHVRRSTIRSGEESVLCSTALLRRGFISADFRPDQAATSMITAARLTAPSLAPSGRPACCCKHQIPPAKAMTNRRMTPLSVRDFRGASVPCRTIVACRVIIGQPLQELP